MTIFRSFLVKTGNVSETKNCTENKKTHKSCSVLVNNQLDAQFFFLTYLFQFYTCLQSTPVFIISSIQTCTLDGYLRTTRVTYTRCIDTVNSPDDEHKGARNM
jgi:hypothetical protein